MKTEQNVLSYGSRRIPFSLSRSHRKRLRLIVKPDLSVQVIAPLDSAEDEIFTALKSKASWLHRQLSELESYHPLPQPLRYESGESIHYLGRQYRLKIEPGSNQGAKLIGRFLFIKAADSKSAARLHDTWLRTRAGDVFEKSYQRCREIAARHGAEDRGFSIRKMKSRWGSCPGEGKILLNLRLVQAPTHCIDYLIMHELCHTVHHNHSPKFYHLLTLCMPDWQKRREVLKAF